MGLKRKLYLKRTKMHNFGSFLFPFLSYILNKRKKNITKGEPKNMDIAKIVKTMLSISIISVLFSNSAMAAEPSPTSINESTISPSEKIAEPFIIDSDFSSDVDDVLAISMACYYMDQKLIDVKGVALCTMSDRGADAMSALLKAHGHGNLPIAIAGQDGIAIGSNWLYNMSNRCHDEDYTYGTTGFYRRLLAQAEGAINIVTLGQLTNLSDLLNSPADGYSPFVGTELVAQKVKCLYAVAGKSDGKLENNIYYGGDDYGNNKYYGNTKVAEAADNVARNWSSPIVWMEADLIGGFSVGSFYEKYDPTHSDICSEALYDQGTSYGATSFDPFGITIAALHSNDLLEANMIDLTSGTMRINLNGTSYFVDNDPARNHYRINKLANDGYYKWIIEKGLSFEYEKRN